MVGMVFLSFDFDAGMVHTAIKVELTPPGRREIHLPHPGQEQQP